MRSPGCARRHRAARRRGGVDARGGLGARRGRAGARNRALRRRHAPRTRSTSSSTVGCRRAAPVRARLVELLRDRPARRPPGADPAARDRVVAQRGDRRGRAGRRAGGPADPWGGASPPTRSPTSVPGRAARAGLAFALPEAEVWATEVDAGRTRGRRANVAGVGHAGARVRLPSGLVVRCAARRAARPTAARRRQPALRGGGASWPGSTAAVPTGSRPAPRQRPDRPRGDRAIVRDVPEWLDPGRARARARRRTRPSGRRDRRDAGLHEVQVHRTWPGAIGCSSPRRSIRLGRVGVADELDVDAMLARFRDRAPR